ncbi:unnamed protein product [Sphenostylis stenocarpa]|uniref:Uncharacterized protein n=1 Tax=Sphenostylis stenocarpa TaxID=92480 RepID=A0AA86S1K6_9FABA|nr:unnamed protein product [Sphenostylis stenocarpa]
MQGQNSEQRGNKGHGWPETDTEIARSRMTGNYGAQRLQKWEWNKRNRRLGNAKNVARSLYWSENITIRR